MPAYRYDDVDTSRSAGTIARLLQQRGLISADAARESAAINARATEQAGNAWAGAGQQIANTVAAIPGQIQRSKEQALDTRLKVAQLADVNAQAQQRAAAATKAKTIDEQNAYIDTVMQQAMKADPDTGVMSFDRPTFEQGLVAGGKGHLYPSLSETLDKLDASAAKRNAESRTMLAHGLLGIEQAGYTPESVLSTAAYLKANGVIKADQLLPVQEAMAADPSPENIKNIVSKLSANLPQYQAEKDAAAKRTADIAHTKAQTDEATARAESLRNPKPPKATEAEQELDAYAKFIGKANRSELSYEDYQKFSSNKAAVTSNAQFQQHMRERTYDNAHPAPVKASDQNALEQQARTLLSRGLSSRSGGLGAEDAKVQTANHLLSSLDQFYDAKTGDYNIPRVQLNELALGLARLTAPGGQAGIAMMKEFEQRTAKGDVAGALTYLTGQPVAANTQGITRMLKESIERQGQTAMDNREGEMGYLRGLMPTELAEDRRKALESKSLNPLRQSRVIQNDKTGERKLQVSTDGGATWK